MSSSSPGTDSAERGLEAYNNIKIPDIYDQQLNLLNPEYLGDYQAQLQNAINEGPTALQDISTDPRLQQAQMDALNELSQVGQSGMTPADKAALDQVHRSSAADAQSKSAQVLSDFARRGMGGSGNELAAQLQNAQSSADRQAQDSDQLLQAQQAAKMAALNNSASLAGSMRTQDYGEQQNLANAKDAIAKFNAQNQQSVQAQNIAAQNAAAQRNLSEKQRIGEAGTATQNQQQQANKALIQQQFQNQIQKAGGQAQQYNNIGQIQQQGAANQGNMMGSLIGAGANLGGAAILSDKTTKKNIHNVDMGDFLDDLRAVKFDYKDPSNGQGKQVGVLADDVEKELPQLVSHDQNGMKHIDAVKTVGPILASLSDIHERLKQFEQFADKHKDK